MDSLATLAAPLQAVRSEYGTMDILFHLFSHIKVKKKSSL